MPPVLASCFDGGFLLGDPAAVAPADLAGVLGGDEGHSSAENAIERDRPRRWAGAVYEKTRREDLPSGGLSGMGFRASKTRLDRAGRAQNSTQHYARV